MSLLTAKSFNFANGHPFNPNRNQRIFHIVRFERFNDCLDFLHQFLKDDAKRSCVQTIDQVQRAIEAIVRAARTKKIGDGKVFVCAIDQVIRIRTEERGEAAI